MSNPSDDDGDIDFGLLGQMSEHECPQCGELTSRYSEVCEACGATLAHEQDVSLNISDGSGSRLAGAHKVPMEEAKNLLKLKEAHQGLASGRLSAEEYSAVVEDVLSIVESALELYNSAYMKDQLSRMEPPAADIYKKMAAAAAEMEKGLARMLKYGESGSLADVEAGLAKVEEALWKVDAAQDVAVSRAEELETEGV